MVEPTAFYGGEHPGAGGGGRRLRRRSSGFLAWTDAREPTNAPQNRCHLDAREASWFSLGASCTGG